MRGDYAIWRYAERRNDDGAPDRPIQSRTGPEQRRSGRSRFATGLAKSWPSPCVG